VKDGHTLTWEQAIQEFRDRTGRSGPATWELGDYPKGQDDFPVTGVSWYEAAAYAEFVGKTLPSVYEWYHAAGPSIFSDNVNFSNFSGSGPVKVGSLGGISRMALMTWPATSRNGAGTSQAIAATFSAEDITEAVYMLWTTTRSLPLAGSQLTESA